MIFSSLVLALISSLTLIIALILWLRSGRRAIHRWKRQYRIDQHEAIFNLLYQQVNGFQLSQESRKHQDALAYVYGEIEFMPFIALLSLARPGADTVFYDLGCGTGKAVLAAMMVFDIKKSCGVEIFPKLYTAACSQARALSLLPGYENKDQHIHFFLENFLDSDLEEATLIFINASAFFGDLWQAIEHKMASLRRCQTIITTTKTLSIKEYRLTKQTQVQMSWGIVKAYIHQRRNGF